MLGRNLLTFDLIFRLLLKITVLVEQFPTAEFVEGSSGPELFFHSKLFSELKESFDFKINF